MSFFLHPGCYDDTEIPAYRGQPLIVAAGDATYEFYLHWLADHLWSPEVPAPDEPPDLAHLERRAATLAENAFFHRIYCLEPFEEFVEDGARYEDVFRTMQRRHQQAYAHETDPDCIESLEDWINPAVWENALREIPESRRCEGGHADIPYRGELRALLCAVPDHQDRYAILDSFYRSWCEEARK